MRNFNDAMITFERFCLDREPFVWSIIWGVATNYDTQLESMSFDIDITNWDKRVRALTDIIKNTPPDSSNYRYVRELKYKLNTKLINNHEIGLSKKLLSATYDAKSHRNLEISKKQLKEDMMNEMEQR